MCTFRISSIPRTVIRRPSRFPCVRRRSFLQGKCRNIHSEERYFKSFWNMIAIFFSFSWTKSVDWFFNSWKVLEFSLNPITGKLTTSPSSAGSKANQILFKEIAVWHFFVQLFCEFICIDFHRNRLLYYELSQLPGQAVSVNLRGRRVNLTSFTSSCVSIHQHFQVIGIFGNIVNRHIKGKAILQHYQEWWIVVFTGHIVCWNGSCCVNNPCSLLTRSRYKHRD